MFTRTFGTTTEEHKTGRQRLLTEGGLVAFPTETVYGLGADALECEKRWARCIAAKGRPV